MLDIVNKFTRGKNILLVAFDAGGANQLFSLFDKVSSYESLNIICDGPAKKIYEQIFKRNYIQNLNIPDLLSRVNLVVSSTGLGSDLEYSAIAMAKKKDVYVVSLLDHWVNYRERFIRGNTLLLPDEIWVVDEYAKKISHEIFPELKIKLVPDMYMENIREEVSRSKAVIKKQVLFLLEPIVFQGARTIYLNPLEKLYLENFLQIWESTFARDNTILKLRPHPSEPNQKYATYAIPSRVVMSDLPRLSQDLAESSVVVGYHSYAMTVAKGLGKEVLCALPVGVECELPHINIPRIFT